MIFDYQGVERSNIEQYLLNRGLCNRHKKASLTRKCYNLCQVRALRKIFGYYLYHYTITKQGVNILINCSKM